MQPTKCCRVIPSSPDTQAFCAHYGIPLEDSANAIIVASKKEPRQYSACLALATTRLDVNHAVRRLMSVKRLSFASAEQTMELTGMMVGGGDALRVTRRPAALHRPSGDGSTERRHRRRKPLVQNSPGPSRARETSPSARRRRSRAPGGVERLAALGSRRRSLLLLGLRLRRLLLLHVLINASRERTLFSKLARSRFGPL